MNKVTVFSISGLVALVASSAFAEQSVSRQDVVAKVESYGGFTYFPNTSSGILVTKSGDVISYNAHGTRENPRNIVRTEKHVMKLSGEMMLKLAGHTLALSPAPLKVIDPNAPRCVDAPATKYVVVKAGQEISIATRSNCIDYGMENTINDDESVTYFLKGLQNVVYATTTLDETSSIAAEISMPADLVFAKVETSGGLMANFHISSGVTIANDGSVVVFNTTRVYNTGSAPVTKQTLFGVLDRDLVKTLKKNVSEIQPGKLVESDPEAKQCFDVPGTTYTVIKSQGEAPIKIAARYACKDYYLENDQGSASTMKRVLEGLDDAGSDLR